MQDKNLEYIRHSLAHLLAAAVLELYPGTKNTIGPAVENGFYYDFEFPEEITVSDADLPKIEKKMIEILKTWQGFEGQEVSEGAAKEKFNSNEYKHELIDEIVKKDEKITLYKSGEFTDLCRGGHVDDIKKINPKAFKLERVAGAYWRGDEKNKMLTRIYGFAFEKPEELKAYKLMLVEAKKRDHRKIGKDMGLFVFSELVGPGLPLYTPRGAALRQTIVDYSNELQQAIGYEPVHSPNINKAELFKISGHYDKFKDDMLKVKSHYTDEEYFLKPMNCPMHTQIFAGQARSYKDLPVKFADFANLYRDEKPGELSGLTRLRCFSQDDGHCFCREDQIEEEFTLVLEAIKTALKTYGMEYWVRLSLRDPGHMEKYLGDAAVWDKSEKILEDILVKNKIKFEKAEGEAAFYGPKMDIMVHDAIGREWQISTIQLDFSMPKRFELKYAGQDGTEKTPVMIHRALVGSPERFMGILIEHYSGAFPVWLAPVQVQLVSVGEDFNQHVSDLAAELKVAGIKVEIDTTDETVGKKIRNAVKLKPPYTLVIGEKEINGDNLAVRVRGKEELEEYSKKDFISKVQKEIADRVA